MHIMHDGVVIIFATAAVWLAIFVTVAAMPTKHPNRRSH
jgi:hypothetical protein